MNETKVETKEELIQNIKEWIKIDNDINKLNKELKELKLKQKLFTKNLLNVIKVNQLEFFDINGGRIMYKKNKLKKPINTKMLLQTLKNYYTDNPTIANEVTEYILSNREEVIKETIKRKIDK